MPRPATGAVPMFFLYGEPRQSVSPRFLHVETLETRCRPGDWMIRPHTHGDLHHLFLIAAGGGHLQADGRSHQFVAPCLLTIPADVVHGFAWQPETRGHVVTVSEGYLNELRGRTPSLDLVFGAPLVLPVTDPWGLSACLQALERELAWSALGHEAAIEANLMMLLVGALRLHDRATRVGHQSTGRAAELVARFRAMIETHYRACLPIDDYARRLGVTSRTLRRACTLAARRAPAEMIQDRVYLEAQRIMLYTTMHVGEAADHLGFRDCAYFSRFFARRAGRSATSFRNGRGRRIDPV